MEKENQRFGTNYQSEQSSALAVIAALVMKIRSYEALTLKT